MKLACQEQLAPGVAYADKIAWLERYGFAGVEISGHGIGTRIAEVQRAMAGSTVRISAMHGGYGKGLINPDPDIMEQTRLDLQGLLKYCALLECPGLIVVSSYRMPRAPGKVQAPPPASDDQIEQMAEGLAELADAADEYGVKLYLEPANRYESDLLHTIDDAVRVCRAVGRESVAVSASTFHMNIEESSLTVPLARHADRIEYIHLADSNRGAPGTGHLPFRDLAMTYRTLKYDGYLSLECTGGEEEELLKAKRFLEKL